MLLLSRAMAAMPVESPPRPPVAPACRRRGLPRRVLLALLFISLNSLANADVPTYTIGAIVPNDRPDLRRFLEYTYQHANEEYGKPFDILVVIKEIQPDDGFQASIKACELVEQHPVVALLAPSGKFAGAAVQSVGDLFEIPVVHYSPDFQTDDPASLYLNVYPHFTTVNRVLLQVVNYYKWTQMAILYEHEDGLRRMEDLLRAPKEANSSFTAWRIRVGPSRQEQDRLIQTLKEFRHTNIKRVIVDCHPATLTILLEKMLMLQMLTEYHHYIFTSFALTEFFVENYTQGDMNITAFQIMDYGRVGYTGVRDHFLSQHSYEDLAALAPLVRQRQKVVTLEMSLMFDGLYLVRKGLRALGYATSVQGRKMSCASPTGWQHGLSLMNYIRMSTMQGISGTIQLNGLGQSVDMHVNIMERRLEEGRSQLKVVGNWTNLDGVNITQINQTVNAKDLMSNKTIRVTTIVSAPFTVEATSEDLIENNNDKFKGYCIDLLKEMKAYMKKDKIDFKYEIHIVADHKYGNEIETAEGKRWNGMVGELMDNKADLAVAPLTINHLRQEVIDFSTPFMNLGISILYRLQENKTPSIFSFLKPLHYDIWMYLIVSYVAISMVLFIMARFTPYEWYRPHEDSDEVENQFTLINALWFSAGAMMQQGSEISPRALSTRIVTGTWWFFVLICIASYTANLAAFLTVTRMEAPIKSADDLSQQTKIKYGTVEGGSTMSFFKYSDIPTYARMWQFMSNQEPSVFVDKTTEGIKRVEKEDYAFLMESSMLEYQVSQQCNLTQIGGLLDSKFYGIGLQKNSPYTGIISKAILQMQDDGVLVKLKKKWWEDQGKCINSKSGSGADDASSLKLDSIGGIFYVLVFGTILGCVIAVMEFIWKSKKNAARDKLPIWKEMLNELGFAFRCRDAQGDPSKSRESLNMTKPHQNGPFTELDPAATAPPGTYYATPAGGGSFNPVQYNTVSSFPGRATLVDSIDYSSPTAGGYRHHSHSNTLPHQGTAAAAVKFAPENPSILKHNSTAAAAYSRHDTKV